MYSEGLERKFVVREGEVESWLLKRREDWEGGAQIRKKRSFLGQAKEEGEERLAFLLPKKKKNHPFC